MRGKQRLRDARDGKSALAAVVIVVILIVSSIGVFLFATSQGSSNNATVKSGSTVKVNYIGYLSDGRVFDTSFYSVASDNGSYPKSVFFSMRANESSYAPLEFVVGSATVIKGFSKAVMGLKVGESRNYTVVPAEGYGSMTESKKITFDLDDTLPVYFTMTASAFKTTYKVDPTTGLTVSDAKYGWNVRVINAADTSAVLLMNQPTNGTSYRMYGSNANYGWDVQVTSVNPSEGEDGVITIHHNLTAESVRKAGGLDGNTRVLVIDVNEDAMTATIYRDNSYTELRGVDMTFNVTVVSIS